MRILVTGGAGFIGSHVVRRLLEEGREVRVLDDFSTGRASNLTDVADDVDLHEGDLRRLGDVEAAMRGCEAAIHLGAVPSVPRSIADPVTTHEANATGTLNVLLAARAAGASRVVLASSSSVYGSGRELPKHEALRPEPISPYAVSKLAAEAYARSFFEVYGLETVALRYFNVFGPRQDPQSEYAAVIPKLIWSFRNAKPPVIFGDVRHSLADVSRAREELGYDPSVTLKEGLRRTVEFFAEAELRPAQERRHGLRPVRQSAVTRHAVPAPPSRPERRRGRRYLITGGAGFIGSHLLDAMLGRGQREEVVILDDLSTGCLENIQIGR